MNYINGLTAFVNHVRDVVPADLNTLISAAKGMSVAEGAIQSIAIRTFALLALGCTVAIGAKMLYNRLDVKSALSNTATIATLGAVALFSYQLFNLSQGKPVNKELFMAALQNTQTFITTAFTKFAANF